MIRRLRCFIPILCASAIFAAGGAQPPSPAPAAGAPPAAPSAPRPQQKPTNLKVLPQNTDLRVVMHQYEADLGVHCRFCHAAADETTHRTNFASDSNPMKETARYMIQMTADLNEKYLAQMPMRDFADPITCGTCHRGQGHPSVFAGQPPAEPDRPAGAPAALAPGAAPAAAPPTGSSR
ncbi:MAG TPA: c-type cytochrome [Acidobacteriaceae bacterium]|nr:c-type cytochrome [Acidobacteriaceae bacterium]